MESDDQDDESEKMVLASGAAWPHHPNNREKGGGGGQFVGSFKVSPYRVQLSFLYNCSMPLVLPKYFYFEIVLLRLIT